MAGEFFRMRGITRSYHLADEDVPVLRGIDLDIERGEYLSCSAPQAAARAR